MQSAAERLSCLPQVEREAILAEMSDDDAQELLYDWRGFLARSNQIAPEGDWDIWTVLAGRGFGKTRIGAEWVKECVAAGAERVALIGETAADTRDVMVEGESGLLSIYPKSERPLYEPSKRQVTWPNGAIAKLYNATEPDQLRGPQHSVAWSDELAKWRYARATWDQLQFGLRLGDHPRQIVTTTPRPIELIKSLVSGGEGKVHVTVGETMDNRSNLADSFLDKISARYAGTRLGRQELSGEILGDIPNALWSLETIDLYRSRDIPDEMGTIGVAIDPQSGGLNHSKKRDAEDSLDETGIVVAGTSPDDQDGYVLEDGSIKGSPAEWAVKAIALYDKWEADFIVVEVNNGGAMVSNTIKTIRNNIPIREVWASRGKHVRAEPISSLYQLGRIHHVGAFIELETQMTQMTSSGFEGDGSPDRCLIAGTMIETEFGATPIESVCVGDKVWTRKGLRRVTASEMTNAHADVIDVAFSNDAVLSGTGNHPVFVEGIGFVDMDALVCGDTISHIKDNHKWLEKKQLSSTDSHTQGIQTAPARVQGGILTGVTATGQEQGRSIGMFTSFIMDRYRRAFTSTTRTRTTSIIQSAISRLYLQKITQQNMNGFTVMNSRLGGPTIWTEYATSPNHGMRAQKAGHGMRGRQRNLMRRDRQKSTHATSAGMNSRQRRDTQRVTSLRHVAEGALTRGMSALRRFISRLSALFVGLTSCKGNKDQQHAGVNVVRSTEREKQLPVYNLTVEGENEYYANGILVHNCDALVWAMTALFPSMVNKKKPATVKIIPTHNPMAGM